MTDDDSKDSKNSRPETAGDDSAAAVEAPRAEDGAKGGGSTEAKAGGFAWGTLPGKLLGVLKDPVAGLKKQHEPGTSALIQGLAVGLGSVVLIQLIHLLTIKSIGGNQSVGEFFKQLLGGGLFFAAAAALSFLVERLVAKSEGAWQDHVYLVGNALVFLLAATVVGAIFTMLEEKFFTLLGAATTTAGTVMMAVSLFLGLQEVNGVTTRAALWIVICVFAGALLAGGLLNFWPTEIVPPTIFQFIPRAPF